MDLTRDTTQFDMPQQIAVPQTVIPEMPMMDAAPALADDFWLIPEPTPSGTERIKAKVLDWQWKNAQFSLQQTQQLHSLTMDAENRYLILQKHAKSQKRMGSKINTRETANQVDVVSANYAKAIFSRPEVFRAEAEAGEDQAKADATSMVMRIMLNRTNFKQEIRRDLKRYNKFRLACMRVGIEYVSEAKSERVSLPVSPDEMFAPQARPIAQADPDAPMSDTLYETTSDKRQGNYYIRSVDLRQLAFSDMYRPIETFHKQPSIHEAHYWTMDELEDAKFRDLDKLASAGDANTSRSPSKTDNLTSSLTGINAAQNFPVWEIWESWSVIPWMKWLGQGEITEQELQALAAEYGFDPAEFATKQKWCMFHSTHRVLAKLYPNFLSSKMDVPYRFMSWVLAENGPGNSFEECIEDLGEYVNDMVNLGADNARIRQYQSVAMDTMSTMDRRKLEELGHEKAIVELEFGQGNPKDKLLFSSDIFPDMSENAQQQIGLAKSLIATYGANDVIQGQGSSGRATTDVINNSRGQEKIDEPLQRYVENVLVPCLEMVRDLIFFNFDTTQFVQMIGEHGVTLAKLKKVVPGDITNRFKIVPLTEFDIGNRQQKANSLMAAMNILSRNPADPQMLRIFGEFLKLNGFSSAEIAEITNNYGEETDPEDEIYTMLVNPNEDIRVRMEDNHEYALMIASQAVMAYPQLADQDNFKKYVERHMMLMQIVAAQAAMQATQSPGFKGPSKQVGDAPEDQIGDTRQQAQLNSPPDVGAGTNSGMTGQASNKALGKTAGFMADKEQMA